MKKTIIISALSFLFISTSLILLNPLDSKPENQEEISSMRFYEYFKDDSYLEYITKEISFKTVSFTIITIKKGDNFWKIAKKFSIDIDTLIGSNPQWDSLIARIDQQIVVPSEKGTLHFIKDFDELEALPEIYDVPKEDIIVQELPFFYKLYYPLLDEKKPVAIFVRNTKPCTSYMNEELADKYELREKFRSPLGGRFSSFFGRRKHPIFSKKSFHNGIDIAARYGTYVGASRAGVVISTGWMGGYGKAVIIRHDNGYKTLYGHLSRITTRKGRHVKSGSIIGRVGSTGYSTGPHLHFTIWHYGRLINPLKVLW